MTVVLLASALFAQAPKDRRNFVACPIVRDTKSQPCWLAEYNGETYFLGIQGGVADEFYPPQLNHMALIEGTVGTGRVCGGIPLNNVKVSVLPEIAPTCNTILPAEDGIEAPPRKRTQGPPAAWVKLNSPDSAILYYDFDSDFHSLHMNNVIADMVARAKAGKQVEVRGYRGATLLSDGSTVMEKAGLSAIRANKVAAMFRDLGVPAGMVSTAAPEVVVKTDGVNDPWNRRVEITLR